jgi:hypothetical protein
MLPWKMLERIVVLALEKMAAPRLPRELQNELRSMLRFEKEAKMAPPKPELRAPSKRQLLQSKSTLKR